MLENLQQAPCWRKDGEWFYTVHASQLWSSGAVCIAVLEVTEGQETRRPREEH